MKQLMIEAFDLKQKGYYKQAIEIFYKLLAKENENIEILFSWSHDDSHQRSCNGPE